MMYASGYNRLFLGMLFIIFDINLGPINILPDFAGYIFFYSGLSILSGQHRIFEKGKSISLILVVLTLLDIIKIQDSTLTGQLGLFNLAAMIIGTVSMALNIYLIYIALRGIYLLCEERGLKELKESAAVRWKFYFVIAALLMFYQPFSINLPGDAAVFVFLVGIVNIIAAITVAALFRRARTELGV